MTPENASDSKTARSKGTLKFAIMAIVLVTVAIAYARFGSRLNLQEFAHREAQLREFQERNPIAVYALAFSAYVLITGLSLPGAAVLSLLYGWYFGMIRGVVLISFSSTTGATLAFLLSRFLFRDSIRRRFGDRFEDFNRVFEREGSFYLLSLRLIPAVPFFVINALMGLTSIRVITFWWVSQLGMLPATILYVYAGSSVPSLQTLADKGLGAVFTSKQLTQIVVAFIILGLFPLAVRTAMNWISPMKVAQNTEHGEP